MDVKLDHEQFEGAKVLADIGAKISAGKAALEALEKSKDDFLNGRESEAIARVSAALDSSKNLIIEIGTYHSELVGYSNQVDGFLADVLYLIQSVQRWKEDFDKENAEKITELDAKIIQNNLILEQIKQNRALLAGESEGIVIKRRNLRDQAAKIKDEWETLERASKEINQK